MVDRIVLVEIVTLGRIEDEIDAHVEQAFDMPVHELGGIARRIARDGVLTLEVELARTFFGEHDFKAARLEKARPERKLFVHHKLQQEPHLPALSGKPRRKGEQLFVLICIDVGHVFGPREPRAALALVARNKAAAVRKGQNIDGAVRGAALAHDGARRIAEAVELGGRCERTYKRIFPRTLLGIERGAERAHQPRDGGADDLFARLLFKGAQHGVVQEGAALHDDVLAELFGRPRADDFIDRVLDDGGREPRRNILDGRALLLRLLDRAVHEHRAARTELNGVPRKQPEAGEFFDLHPHRLCERLDEGAAARGARLVEHDGVDDAVLHLEALDVLPADVDDEVDVGIEVERRLEVRHRLDDAEIDLQSRAHHILAVSRDARAADDDPVAHQPIELF